jgi:GNAT superfamily N-acetyltransferase
MISVRPATPDDAAFIADCANALNVLEGRPLTPFTATVVLGDGFGPDPAFTCFIAERKGERAGYAMFHRCYDTDRATRALWLNDLFVLPALRGEGVGLRLFAEVAAEASRRGYGLVAWGVTDGNDAALEFYRKLGATDPQARILELDGAALASLAAIGQRGS